MSSWLSSLFGGAARRDVSLTPEQLRAVAGWEKLRPAETGRPHSSTRYVVADVETTGLSPEKDRLISIGAVAVTNGLIGVDDAFSAVLRQERPSSPENILAHGIGGPARREGADPADALIAFLRYAGKAPLVAYHARFGQAMIGKAMLESLGFAPGLEWIDLAWVMPEVVRDRASGEEFGEKTLDDWLGLFEIESIRRHNAVSDAYATARLLQVAMARGARYKLNCAADFIKAEKARRYKHRAA